MARNLYLVFSRPPEHMSAAEYHSWYQLHARENIETPGFVSAQRYAVRPRVGEALPGGQDHLALYEFDGDYGPIGDHLQQRVGTGDIALPDWFAQIPFASLECEPLGARQVAPGRN